MRTLDPRPCLGLIVPPADGAVPDLTGAQQGHLQHLVEENRRLAETVTELRRDVAFLRSLLTEKGQAA